MKMDPEFILKLAVYTRQHLNIRATANFLLAVAAMNNHARGYLKLYIGDAVRLPSDWIEVAQLSVSLYDGKRTFGSLPSALRKALAFKFGDFDEYQLAKYNKAKKQTAGHKPDATLIRAMSNKSDDEYEIEKLTFTMKQLIRTLHITRPAFHIMAILGKKYPIDQVNLVKVVLKVSSNLS
jgi:telomerase protein component 1